MKLKTLYSRATNGKINEFTIEVEKNKYRTITGYIDGVKTTSSWTECKAKTYCTAEEQALKEAQAIHRKKKEAGAFENIKDIDSSDLFEPMLAKDFIKEKHKIKYPIASQRKLDGVRLILRKNGMWSRNGKKIISAPHIFEALKPLLNQHPDLILDGELFSRKQDCDFNKIISCVRKTKPTLEDLEESKKNIKYFIYDCPSFNGTFTERNKFLKTLKFPECCVLLSTEIANNEKEVMELYQQYISEEYEGQILRVLNSKYENKRSSGLLKHKTFFDKEFIIKDVIEGIGKLQGKVGALVFEIDGKQFNSSVNGDHEYLERLFKSKNLIGKQATIKYFELTSDGVPRFPKVLCVRDFE